MSGGLPWRVEVKPRLGGLADHCLIVLHVAAQALTVGRVPCETREDAERVAGMLRRAIVRIEAGALLRALDAIEGLPDGRDCTRVIAELRDAMLPSCAGCEDETGECVSGTRQHP